MVRGERVGPESDVHSMGALLYFMLTALSPFAARRAGSSTTNTEVFPSGDVALRCGSAFPEHPDEAQREPPTAQWTRRPERGRRRRCRWRIRDGDDG